MLKKRWKITINPESQSSPQNMLQVDLLTGDTDTDPLTKVGDYVLLHTCRNGPNFILNVLPMRLSEG